MTAGVHLEVRAHQRATSSRSERVRVIQELTAPRSSPAPRRPSMLDLSANVRYKAESGVRTADTGLQYIASRSAILKRPSAVRSINASHVNSHVPRPLRRGTNLRRDAHSEPISNFANGLNHLDRSSVLSAASVRLARQLPKSSLHRTRSNSTQSITNDQPKRDTCQIMVEHLTNCGAHICIT